MRYLAQREHSRMELARKLSRHATEAQPEDIANLLTQLEQAGLLSDRRFAASFVRSHAARSGVLRLRHDLRAKGVADADVDAALSEALSGSAAEFGDEQERARLLWARKFGSLPSDQREFGRQARFLQARGFSSDIIFKLLKQSGEDA